MSWMTAASASSTHMNSTELVRDLTNRTRPRRNSDKRAVPLFSTELAGPVRQAILRTRQNLLSEQCGNGIWCGRQRTDASLAALSIVWLAYTDRAQSELAQQCASAILELQLPEGGWSRAPGVVADVNTSTQAYFALKLVGIDPTSSSLVRAREVIRNLGGADAADATTRMILTLFGQINYEHCGRAASEQPLFELEQARQTSSATILARKPVCKIECERGVRELFTKRPCDWPATKASKRERMMSCNPADIEELPFDELIWHMIALHANGASLDGDQMQACEQQFSELIVVDEDDYAAWPDCDPRLLADTALAAKSLMASGLLAEHDAIGAALVVLCRKPGHDRSTTSQLCSVLAALPLANAPTNDAGSLPPEFEVFGDWSHDDVNPHMWEASPTPMNLDQWNTASASERFPTGVLNKTMGNICDELIARQNLDGGWSADRRGVSDPTVTGNVLEALANIENESAQLSLDLAVEYLKESQQGDGSWRSAIGAEQIRATSSAILGLAAAGVLSDDDAIAAGLNWLVVEQQSNGGWREGSSDENPSPTSWAVLAFVAAGKSNHKACRRGIHFLVEAQGDDGRWTDSNFAVYDALLDRWIHNDLHSTASPLLALSRWAVSAASAQTAANPELSLRLVGVSADE